MTFEHTAEPLRLRAADLRELRAHLRAEHPNQHITSIKDELGNLAGSPPPTTRVDAVEARPWRLAIMVAPVGLAAAGYGLSWLLT